MLLDDKYNQLERLLKEYPMESQEYWRIQLLMFGYTDDEIDEIMYKPKWGRQEWEDVAHYHAHNDESVNDYKDICSIPIMTDEYYFERYNGRSKIMTDSYINLNDEGGSNVK